MAAKLYFFIVNCFVLFSFIFCEDELTILDDTSFEHLTQAGTGATTGDWLIVFSRDHSECATCKPVEELFVKIHAKFQQKLNVAKVMHNPSSQLTLKRFQVTKWPSVSLFHHGLQYYYTSDTYKEELLTEFVEEFNTFTHRKVPEPITMFDVKIEEFMDDIKHITRKRKNAAVLIFFSGVLFGLMLTEVLKCIVGFFISTFSNDSTSKDCGKQSKKETKNKGRKKDD